MPSPDPDRDAVSGGDLTPPYASREFAAYLTSRELTILDVRQGSAPGSRRLLLGRPSGRTVEYVVAVDQTRGAAVDNEQAVLEAATAMLRPAARAALPKVVERIEVFTSMEGLVLTAAPGLRVNGPPWTGARAHQLLGEVAGWLGAVWTDTAGAQAPVDLGSGDVEEVLGRQRVPRLEPALDAIRTARARLGEYQTPRTLVHGCLCPLHATLAERGIGVDDWGLGSPAGDPLRDLGRMAVHVAGGRLPEVLAGRSGLALAVQRCMTEALAHTPVPPRLWREIVVLTQVELARDALEQGDENGIRLLGRAVRLSRALTRTR